MASKKPPENEDDPQEEAGSVQPKDQGAGLTLSQDQFAELLAAVRESGVPDVRPPEPELDLANDPNVWTWDRVRQLLDSGEIDAVRFIPDETLRIGWNGLYVYVCKDTENVVPQMHYDVYMDSRKGTREAYENSRMTLIKRVGQTETGAPMATFGTGGVGNA